MLLWVPGGRNLLPLFKADPGTKMIVGFGKIGTTAEEDAADFIEKGGFTKVLGVCIAGRSALEGVRVGHAGAMITMGEGIVQCKIRARREAGAIGAEHFADISKMAKAVWLKRRVKE